MKKEKCDCDHLYTCIYCHKPINVRIQPWNYYFPCQTFHIGCALNYRANNKKYETNGIQRQI